MDGKIQVVIEWKELQISGSIHRSPSLPNLLLDSQFHLQGNISHLMLLKQGAMNLEDA